MRTKLLISAAAAALLAGTVLASAQGARPSGSLPDSGAPAEKMDKMDQGSRSMKGSTTGQSDLSSPSGRSTTGQGQSDQMKSPSRSDGQGQNQLNKSSDQDKSQSRSTTGQSQRDQSGTQMQKDQSQTGSQQSPPGMQNKPSTQSGQSSGQAPRSGANQAQGSSASGSASLSAEQRTKIRTTVLSQKNAPRVSRVDFNISVGTVVPRSVKLVVVPQTVVEVYPAWRGFLFFIVGDQIVIVEPGSLRIVAVISA
jgi:hypothetical protein